MAESRKKIIKETERVEWFYAIYVWLQHSFLFRSLFKVWWGFCWSYLYAQMWWHRFTRFDVASSGSVFQGFASSMSRKNEGKKATVSFRCSKSYESLERVQFLYYKHQQGDVVEQIKVKWSKADEEALYWLEKAWLCVCICLIQELVRWRYS